MFNLNSNEWANLIYSLTILVMLSLSFFARNSNNKMNKIKDLLLWLLIIFVIAIFYNNKNLFNNFVPYMATEKDNGVIEIKSSNDNHFYIMLNINNANILFLIDTGATSTTITERDAKRIGLDTNNLNYNIPVSTANGTSYIAKINKDVDVKLKNININSLDVFVSKDLSGNSLLGMNFLNKLKGYKVEKDVMSLYYNK